MLEVQQLKKENEKKKKRAAPMLLIFGPVSEVHSGPADGQQGAGVVRVGCCPWDPFASIQLSAGNILVYSKRLKERSPENVALEDEFPCQS